VDLGEFPREFQKRQVLLAGGGKDLAVERDCRVLFASELTECNTNGIVCKVELTP